MLALDNLPSEITYMIIEHLAVRPRAVAPRHGGPLYNSDENESYLETLAKLSRTCKRIKSQVEPILYRTFIKPEAPDTGSYHVLRKFLVSIIQRPHLATYTKNIAVGPWSAIYGAQATNERELAEERQEISTIVNAACQLDLPHVDQKTRKSWLTALLFFNEDAEVTLLLALIPTATHLEFWVPHYSELWASFTHKILTPPIECRKLESHGLRSLTYVSGDCYDPSIREDEPKLQRCFPIDIIPNLTTIECRNPALFVISEVYYSAKAMVPMQKLPVVTATLRHTDIDEVRFCLGFCSSLERLEITLFEYDTNSVWPTDRTLAHESTESKNYWRLVASDLSQSAGTLQFLKLLGPSADHCPECLNCDYYQDLETSGVPLLKQYGVIGSLSCYTRLRELEIDQRTLTGDGEEDFLTGGPWDAVEGKHLPRILPPNLESLTLANCTELIFSHLKHVVEQSNTRLVSLRRVNIRHRYHHPGFATDSEGMQGFEALRQEALRKGIEINVTSSPRPVKHGDLRSGSFEEGHRDHYHVEP